MTKRYAFLAPVMASVKVRFVALRALRGEVCAESADRPKCPMRGRSAYSILTAKQSRFVGDHQIPNPDAEKSTKPAISGLDWSNHEQKSVS